MLCPHGANFFVRRKFAALGFGQRSVDVSFFFGSEFIGRLLHACQLQENPRKLVLPVGGQSGYRFNGLFEQAGHVGKYRGFGAF